MPQSLARYARQAAQMYPISEFQRAKIVIYPDWYGSLYCMHIDPGTGETLPIYIDAHVREKLVRAINAIKSEFVDIQVAEVATTDSRFRPYLISIKESNAR